MSAKAQILLILAHLVQDRRAALAANASAPQASSVARSLQFAPAKATSSETEKHKRQKSGASEAAASAAPNASAHVSPLLNMVIQRREEVQEALNHPSRFKFKSRANQSSNVPSATIASTLQLTEEEQANLKLEYAHLDEAWRSNQENPMLHFRPASREPLAPLHLPPSVKPLFLHAHSPISRHPGNHEANATHNAQLTSQAAHPERIPLFPVCSKKCMRCERVLVKPTVDGTSLGPTSGGPDSNAFASLPDFKRRHTALSFTPMIDVKAYDAFDDYKPSLSFDSYNMISLTVTNPPMVPAIHISLSSLSEGSEASTSDEEAASSAKDEAETDQKTISKSSPSKTSEDSICQVDCNGCETWILEDEPIQLDDDLEAIPEPAAWLSHPGVPKHLDLLESDTDNPAISSRKSRQVTMVVLVMPDLKKFEAAKIALNKVNECQNDQDGEKKASSSSSSPPPPTTEMKIPAIIAEMKIKVSWPSPTEEQPDLRHELVSPFRINLSKLFEVIP